MFFLLHLSEMLKGERHEVTTWRSGAAYVVLLRVHASGMNLTSRLLA